jgi:phenylpropionate dioxygenase-like ring-hydroxylating dioxygenase large terminal subunit
MQAATPTKADIHAALARGLKNLWYPLCPSHFVVEQPVSLRRLGLKLAVWRDLRAGGQGKVYALEDHCPHRGAPLSQGANLGDHLACPYHGIEVRCDGMVTKVPASPDCALVGDRAAKSFHVQDAHGAIWLYNGASYVETPPPLNLPVELTDTANYSHFLCYAEWRGDYRYVIDNVMDPMHGTFLHKMSLRNLPNGFVFEKDGQRDVNFDWTEWQDTGTHWMRLEIPYPKTGGPGGSFTIIGSYTPITSPTGANQAAVFFWRCRRTRCTARFCTK